MSLQAIQDVVDFLVYKPRHQPVRVLIVDDDVDVREIWRQMLLSLDVLVTCAGTTREALEKIDAGADILLLDWVLDKNNGSSVLDRWISTDHGPVVIVSGYTGNIDLDELYLRGVCNILIKPIQVATLRAMILRYSKYIMMQQTIDEMTGKLARLQRMVLILIILCAVIQGPQVIEYLVGLLR